MASKHYSDVAKLPAFQDRVSHYLADKCVDVLVAEAATPESQDANQVRFAQRYFQGRIGMIQVCQAITSNGTIRTAIGTKDAAAANDDITDNDLSYVVMTEMFAGLSLSA